MSGSWLVNGSSSGVVRLDLDPAVRARVLGAAVSLRTLRLSLEAPEALLSALSAQR